MFHYVQFCLYSCFNVCEYLTMYRLLFLFHYVHCCHLQCTNSLSVPHNVPSVCSVAARPLLCSSICPLCAHTVMTLYSVSLCPLLYSSVCPLSVNISHCTLSCFLSLCPLHYFTFCPLPLHTSHRAICWFCVTMSNVFFYILPTVCHYRNVISLYSVSLSLLLYSRFCPSVYQYLTSTGSLFNVTNVHCCLVPSFHCLSVPHTVPFVGSVSLFHCFFSRVCLPSVSTSHCTVSLVLFHYVNCFLLLSFHGMSVPHTVPSVGSVSLCPLLSSYVCPLSVSCQHRFLFLCHYGQCCLLQPLPCLSVIHTVS